jgi:hypothetical protein
MPQQCNQFTDQQIHPSSDTGCLGNDIAGTGLQKTVQAPHHQDLDSGLLPPQACL